MVLPSEIMIMVLRCILHDSQDHIRALLVLSHINTTFRQIVLSTSSFWSDVHIESSAGSQELARLFILRSGQSPFNLVISLSNQEFEIEYILGKHANRIKSLSISPASEGWLRRFFLLISQSPMPLPEAIEDLCLSSSTHRVEVALPSAERLHSITISRIIPKYPPTERNHVKTLQFESNDRWRISQIVESILQFPKLERLSFHGLQFRLNKFIISSYDWSWGSTLRLPEIRELYLTYARNSFVGWVMEVFVTPNLETFKMTEPERDSHDWSLDLERWRGGPFSSVRNLLLIHNRNCFNQGQLPEPFIETLIKRFPKIRHLQISIHGTRLLGNWRNISRREGRTL